MFEPVWLGNYIVPRWEAELFVGGSLVLSALVAFAIVIGTIYLAMFVWKQFRF